MRKCKLVIMVVMLLGVLVFGGQSLAANDVLHLYAIYDPSEVKVYMEAFTRDTQIQVEWTRLSAGDCLKRLKAEAKKPQVSIWFGGPSSDFIAAHRADLLASYKSKVGKYLSGDERDPDWYWSGFDFGAIAFVSNVNIFQKNGWAYPTSWQDLLRPEFKSNVSLAFPYTSGTSFSTLAALITLMGEDKAFEYWKQFDNNVKAYSTAGAACVTEVGLGDAAIGVAFSGDILSKGLGKGYPVKMTFPKEGTGFQIGSIALIKNAPEPKLGKAFIDWALGKRAQELLKIAYRVPLNPEASISEGAFRPSEVKLVKNFDAEWFGNNAERLNQKWRQVMGK